MFTTPMNMFLYSTEKFKTRNPPVRFPEGESFWVRLSIRPHRQAQRGGERPTAA